MSNIQININQKAYSLAGIFQELELKSAPKYMLDVFQFITTWFDESATVVQKTSGSTGFPKPIELKKSAMEASAKRTISYFNLTEGKTVWLSLPMDYIAGKMQVIRSVVGNLKLLVTEPTSFPEIPTEKIDFAALVPLQLKNYLKKNISLKNIDIIILGGAAADNMLIRQIQTISPKVFATYGMTETCSHIALQKLNGADREKFFSALEGIEITTNFEGSLKISAPDLLETPIQTNDIVELVDPRHFQIIGRTDNVINSGGLKIYPEEIEKAISKEFNVEVILVGISDAQLGQKLILVSEVEISNKHWSNITNFIEAKFGKNKAPKMHQKIHQFPRNNSMKIDRSEIVKMIESNA